MPAHLPIRGLSWVAAVALAAPSAAQACAICSFAAGERALPPVVPWTLTGIVLYAVVIYHLRPQASWFSLFFDPVFGTLILAFGVFATFTAGPVGGLPLLLLGFIGLGVALHSTKAAPCARGPRLVAVALVLWLAASGTWTVLANARRDDVAYAVRWTSTPAAHEIVAGFERQRDLSALRRLVASPGTFHSGQAALALARLGDAPVDAPLILAAMERAAASPDDSYLVGTYNTALREMLSGKPRHGETPADWRSFLATEPWKVVVTPTAGASAS